MDVSWVSESRKRCGEICKGSIADESMTPTGLCIIWRAGEFIFSIAADTMATVERSEL